jgi:HAD superfamily phosphoserine phosphatase-like hydrolase
MNKKTIKLALLDFDGTLVSKDILDLLCRTMGKEKESEELNEAFHRGEMPGLSALIARINFLKGITQSQINELLEPESYLLPGTEKLFAYFEQHNIITILASGNIVPVLKFYQNLLGIDYVVGSNPQMDGETILGIDDSAYPKDKPFKIAGIEAVLQKYNFDQSQIMAMGDSPSDKGMFEMSGLKIAVNPKGDIAEFADYVVKDNLNKVIDILS